LDKRVLVMGDAAAREACAHGSGSHTADPSNAMVRWRMAAQGSGTMPAKEPTLEALIEALDPEVRAAVDDVDRTLIELSLQLSPWERLQSASRMAQYLARIRDAMASQGG
jgi:hypothetical protein